jgi:uncharacterized protein YecE (DUF72 family)
MGRAYIGTSGWVYGAWREAFYENRPAREWLGFCAARFSGIEVDATFYRLQSRETFRRWRRETPPGFRFDVRYCWFIHIEDGTRGTGTSYEQYVTAFLSGH